MNGSVWSLSLGGLRHQSPQALPGVPSDKGKAEYARFLNIAEGSLAETEYLLMLGRDLDFVTRQAFDEPLKEVSNIARMLNALRVKVER